MTAMQEIMNDSDVTTGLEAFQRHIDTNKINAALEGR